MATIRRIARPCCGVGIGLLLAIGLVVIPVHEFLAEADACQCCEYMENPGCSGCIQMSDAWYQVYSNSSDMCRDSYVPDESCDQDNEAEYCVNLTGVAWYKTKEDCENDTNDQGWATVLKTFVPCDTGEDDSQCGC